MELEGDRGKHEEPHALHVREDEYVSCSPVHPIMLTLSLPGTASTWTIGTTCLSRNCLCIPARLSMNATRVLRTMGDQGGGTKVDSFAGQPDCDFQSWSVPQPRVVKIEEGGDEAVAANQKAWSRHLTFGAPPTPEGAQDNQDLTGLPNVLAGTPVCARCNVVSQCSKLQHPLLHGVEPQVLLYICCTGNIPKKTDSVQMQGFQCDVCHEWYHLRCLDRCFPPYRGSFACPPCLESSILS